VAMTETRARLRNDAEDHARGLGGWPRVLRDQLMLFAPDGCALFLNRPDAWVCRVNAPLTQCVLAGSMGEMPRETNVVRPGAVYQYRVRVPQDLIQALGCREVRRTLGTKDHAEAKRRKRIVAVEVQQEFDRARAHLKTAAVHPVSKSTTSPSSAASATSCSSGSMSARSRPQEREIAAGPARRGALRSGGGPHQ
jgi:hypothetical protein